jgi:hypothetical protein
MCAPDPGYRRQRSHTRPSHLPPSGAGRPAPGARARQAEFDPCTDQIDDEHLPSVAGGQAPAVSTLRGHAPHAYECIQIVGFPRAGPEKHRQKSVLHTPPKDPDLEEAIQKATSTAERSPPSDERREQRVQLRELLRHPLRAPDVSVERWSRSRHCFPRSSKTDETAALPRCTCRRRPSSSSRRGLTPSGSRRPRARPVPATTAPSRSTSAPTTA